jgi:stearoyl-CoA desaturase (delta-9 desaturase)
VPTLIAEAVKKINWIVVIWMTAIHIGALLALLPFAFSWSGLVLCVLLHWLTGGIGICLCYHRLLTHRSFRLVKPLEYLFTFFGDLAAQGGAFEWVGKHRIHHKFSDEPGDPHSPNDGHWWSHMLWVFTRDEKIDGPSMWRRYVPDLVRDPIHRLLHHISSLSPLILAGGLYLVGYLIGGHLLAFSWLVWGVCVRMLLVYHCTWFVNWASHVWGYRTFETTDRSRNLWWVALVTYGEGWHNNHHAYQRSAAHGLRWWEFDMTYWTIRLLGLLRLARDIRLPAAVRAPAEKLRQFASGRVAARSPVSERNGDA